MIYKPEPIRQELPAVLDPDLAKNEHERPTMPALPPANRLMTWLVVRRERQIAGDQ